QLAYEGMVTLVVTIDRETGELQSPPEIVARGVRGFDSTNGMMQDAQRVVAAALAGASRATIQDDTLLKEHLRVELKRFIQKLTGSRPVILPVVVSV
ncbi:MAG TPA: hypothetical protein VJV03_16295, partial [Pyrinomonadaceae bacterium]|nr:hypothetical protein [Pyrinomonadaceae bacterium]